MQGLYIWQIVTAYILIRLQQKQTGDMILHILYDNLFYKKNRKIFKI